VIGLGLRLALRGGRETVSRLVVVALGIAVGVGLLVFTLAGFSGLHAQDVRWGWLTTSGHNQRPSVDEAAGDPLWWRLTEDHFGSRTIERVDVAATGPRSPVPPGISRLPGPGEYYASPALAGLLSGTSPALLGDRFAGREAGIIGQPGLTAPDALIVVVGHPVQQLAGATGAIEVRSIETAPRQHGDSAFLRVVLGLGAVGLLFPVLIFVGTATRLAAARREERFAAMRLVGASPGQVNALASVEAALAALAGTVIGFALFWMLRPPVAGIPFDGSPFFTGDLSPSPLAIGAVVLGVPAGAAAAAVVSLRRVRLSPLGVSRRVTPPPPRAGRLAPLACGVAGLGILAVVSRHVGLNPQVTVLALVVGFAVCVAGVAAAGPWLTLLATRLVATRGSQAASLIASRRLADNPGQAFRAVSGVALVVYVATVFTGFLGTEVAIRTAPHLGVLAPSTVMVGFYGGGVAGLPSGDAAALVRRLDGLSGVGLVVPIYAAPATSDAGEGRRRPPPGPQLGGLVTAVQVTRGLVACPALDRLGALGRCTSPTGVTTLPTSAILTPGGYSAGAASWPASPAPAAGLDALPLQALLVTTDGALDAVERVRTAIDVALPLAVSASTAGELTAAQYRQFTDLERMADVGIVLTVLVAGCSLAVGVAGGLVERRRPFALLRLSGMRLADLRRVVLLESAAPLVVAAVVSAATGLLSADLILTAIPGTSLRPPSAEYYLGLAGGLAVAMGAVGATLPLLRRITNPEDVRLE
jgi:hypothetical protein